MSRILAIDVGSGTMDVLWYDTSTHAHFKAVVRSPVQTIADQVLAAEGDLLLDGVEMGGGAVTRAIRQRAQAGNVFVTATAATTISNDPEKVSATGVTVIADGEAGELARKGEVAAVTLGDIEPARIRALLDTMGVPFEFDVVAVCVQDHGRAPPGTSSLDYRHNHFVPLLDEHPTPATLLYASGEVPDDMPRLSAVRYAAATMPARAVYVMDSGMAAMLGGTLDPRVKASRCAIILDVATSHTVAASFEGDELCAFVEYHTRDVQPERLADLLRDLADGRLEHARVLAEGGHGAYTRRGLGYDTIDIILATGPRRGMLAESHVPLVAGAPLGDNMMTGTLGLLEAVRRREGWDKLPFTSV